MLVKPNHMYIDGYLAACREFKELGLLEFSFNDPDEFDIWGPELCQRYEDNSLGFNLKEGYVPATTFWMVKGSEFIGEGNIRHMLTPALERFGGHIGYAVRASMWNKGYGTAMLRLLLEEAAYLGLNRALITCDDDNIPSRRIIEKNNGIYQDTITNNFNERTIQTRRYWVEI